tara:strand:+ start:785 stop:1096 length:312 start_codon:yes stop_codon:yes gene_type:complete
MATLTRWEAKAIKAINPSAEFNATTIDSIDWLNGTASISKSDIQTKAEELRVAGEYKINRANAFPKFHAQLDKLYDDITNGKLDATGEWYQSIKAVKDANPKS